MNRPYLILIFTLFFINLIKAQNEFIERQGQISFFSYTSVENIEARNNQVLSIIDIEKKEIAVSMLMRAFTFKKDLMYEHFNESYIESDNYPKANFQGDLPDFDFEATNTIIKRIKGTITIHGISKEINMKTKITKTKKGYMLDGEFNLTVKDFDIKIPPLLSKNIAKVVSVKIKFEYTPYEN